MVVYNGESYNYRELRTELASTGQKVRSESDIEVPRLMSVYHLSAGQQSLAERRAMKVGN